MSNTFDSLTNMHAHMQIITNNIMGVGGCMGFEARNLIVLASDFKHRAYVIGRMAQARLTWFVTRLFK